MERLPQELIEQIPEYQERIQNKSVLADFICRVCEADSFQLQELAAILNKSEKYLLFNFIKPLRELGLLEYTIADMPNHFQQAYRTVKK